MWTHFIKCSEVLSNEWLSSAAQDWDSNPSGLPPASFFNFKLLHFVFLRDLHSCWIMEKWLQQPQNFVRYLSFQRNWWNSTVYREENTKVSLKCWKKITSGKLGWGRRCRWREAKTKLFVFVFRTSFFTPPQHRQLFWKLYFFFCLGCLLPKHRDIILYACISSHTGICLIHSPTGISTQPLTWGISMWHQFHVCERP